jgi:predicted transcriptional regulator with HTH domain
MANTEITYVKNRIKEVQEEMKNVLLILIESGMVEIVEENGKKVYKVNKIK